jgi:hypothetical protein
MKTRQEAIENNASVLNERDGRPGLDYRYQAYVVEIEDGKVLLGGLGGMGLGQMWVDELPRHKDYPGYAEACA